MVANEMFRSRNYYNLLFGVICIGLPTGTKNAVCPESKKLYPRDCRLFYKCVPLLESAQAYVWVPTRCTAGLVFHPTIKQCIEPDKTWNCEYGNEENGNIVKETDESDFNMHKPDIIKENMKPLYKSQIVQLNVLDENSVPFSAVNNPYIDPIGSQMQRLKELINSLKASSTPVPAATTQVSYQQLNPMESTASAQKPPRRETPSYISQDLKKTTELNFLPAELNKITAQLVEQTPNLQHQTNLHSLAMNTDTLTNVKQHNTASLVNSLYDKYLSNNTFLSHGEFVKNKSFSLVAAKNPEQTPKISTVIGLTDKNSFTVHNYRTPPIPDIKPTKTKCRQGERLPNNSDCTRYYLCGKNNTIIHTFTCPSNTAFNKVKKICDIHEHESCMKLDNEYYVNRDRQTDINVNDNVTCTSHGRFPVRQSPSQYIVCIFQDKIGWESYRLNCPLNTEFCLQKKTCLSKYHCQ